MGEYINHMRSQQSMPALHRTATHICLRAPPSLRRLQQQPLHVDELLCGRCCAVIATK
jgi:hypothetical protein